MSGGYFRYEDRAIEWRFAEAIEDLIGSNDDSGINYPPEVIEKFREAVVAARRLKEMLHCIDYLVSYDYGEDSFLEAWKRQVEEARR